ncbi:hypothetical protein ABBQ32_010356 [Trebouxia sp. C0010 RCD-2024]
MSKKNKLSTRKNSHSHILEREKADQLKRTAKAHKTDRKVSKANKDGKVVKRKFKGIRIRKGVRIKGIKVTDADSKKKALKVLKAEQAMREMDIDSDASDDGSDVKMK